MDWEKPKLNAYLFTWLNSSGFLQLTIYAIQHKVWITPLQPDKTFLQLRCAKRATGVSTWEHSSRMISEVKQHLAQLLLGRKTVPSLV